MFLILGRESRPRRRGSIRGAFGDLREIVRSGRFWVFMAAMFLGGGVEMGFTFWSASYIQLRFGASAAAGGFGAACFAGGMILGRFAFGHWVAQRHLKRLIILSALAGMVVGAVFPFVDRIWAVHATLLFCGIAVACFWPSIQSYSVDCLRMDPTMIFILLSCGGIPGCAAVSWSMGRIGDAKDLRTAFLLLPPLFLCLALLILTTKPRPAVAVDGLFDGSD
jgi:fucose permease